MPRFAVRAVEFHGTPGYAAGTGYTGEDGVELHVPAEAAPERLADGRSAPGSRRPGSAHATRCGSRPGCRCTATSSGPGITPAAGRAGLGRAVGQGDFRGRAALEAERERGVARRLRGLLLDGRQIPPARAAPCSSTARRWGRSRAGTSHPCSNGRSRSAFLPPDVAEGTAVSIDVRGRAVDASVVPTAVRQALSGSGAGPPATAGTLVADKPSTPDGRVPVSHTGRRRSNPPRNLSGHRTAGGGTSGEQAGPSRRGDAALRLTDGESRPFRRSAARFTVRQRRISQVPRQRGSEGHRSPFGARPRTVRARTRGIRCMSTTKLGDWSVTTGS